MTPIGVANAVRTAERGRTRRACRPAASSRRTNAFQLRYDTVGPARERNQFSPYHCKSRAAPASLSKWPTHRAEQQCFRPGARRLSSMPAARSFPPKPKKILQYRPRRRSRSAPFTDSSSAGAATDANAMKRISDTSSGTGNANNTASQMGPPDGGASAALSTANGPTAGGAVGSGSLNGGAAEDDGPFPSTSLVRLEDVAQSNSAHKTTTPSAPSTASHRGLGLYQLPGTNATDVADRVREKMEELKKGFRASITSSLTTSRPTSATPFRT